MYTHISVVTKIFFRKVKTKPIHFCKSTNNQSISGMDRVDTVIIVVLFQEAGWSRFDFTNYILYRNNKTVNIQQTLSISKCTQITIVKYISKCIFPKVTEHTKENKDTFLGSVINEGIQCIDRVGNVIVFVCLRRLGGQEINYQAPES